MKSLFTIFGSMLLPCVVAAGCASGNSGPSKSELASLEKKVDQLLARFDPASGATGSKGIGGNAQLAAKLDELLSRLPTAAQGFDTSKLSRTSTSDLAWFLITNDPMEKKELALRRVGQSTQHKEVTPESIQSLANDLEGFNVILNAPELLDADVLQQVEDARNRLVELLRSEVPGVVRKLDEQALKSTDYAQSKRLWAESSAVLGFYPSSNDPVEAGKIQELVSAHDLVRARIELLQQQRYNLWVRHASKSAKHGKTSKTIRKLELACKPVLNFWGRFTPVC